MITSYRTWAERLPSGWSVIPAGVAFSEPKELSRPDDLHLTPSQNYGVVTQDEYREITGHQLVRNTKSAANMKHVEPDDFIISMASHLSGLERSHVAGKVSGDYRVVRPSPLYSPGFLGYLMKSRGVIEHLNLLTTEIRVGQRISYDRFSFIGLPLPPVNTQRAITDYLDRETAEIDAMTADLDELEKLLTERRATTVRSTMDRAADFGRIPLGYVAQTVSGATPSTSIAKYWADSAESGIHWVSIGDMSSVPVVLETQKYVSTEGRKAARLKVAGPGTVLFAMYGATLGAVSRLGVDACWNQAILGVFPHESRLRPEFLESALIALKPSLEALHRGNTQNNLNAEQVKGLPIPLPPLEVQEAISQELSEKTAEIDAMLADITELRDLLAERRAAVIAAAVTGQIDIPVAEETTHA